MPTEATDRTETKETVSHSLPASLVRAIEYRAFLDRTNKSEALARLIRVGVIGLQQDTPDEVERRTA
jgi:hypothetical protein